MLEAFLSPAYITRLQTLLKVPRENDSTALRNLWLLPPNMQRAFRAGHLEVQPFGRATSQAKDKLDSEEEIIQTARVSHELQ
jgi:hypothetical protein